jgi:hypothetical protein
MAADMGYDNNRIYAECADRNVAPIIPLRKKQGERHGPIARSSDEWRTSTVIAQPWSESLGD